MCTQKVPAYAGICKLCWDGGLRVLLGKRERAREEETERERERRDKEQRDRERERERERETHTHTHRGTSQGFSVKLAYNSMEVC